MTTDRARTDWPAAFAFYAGLGRGDRTYAKVARRYGVTEGRVRFVARRDKWAERIAKIDAELNERLEREMIESLDQRNRATILMVQKARAKYDGQLTDPAYKLNGRDMAALLRIEQLIEGEATDRIEVRSVRELFVRVITELDSALREILAEKVGDGLEAVVLAAYRDRTRAVVEQAAGMVALEAGS